MILSCPIIITLGYVHSIIICIIPGFLYVESNEFYLSIQSLLEMIGLQPDDIG